MAKKDIPTTAALRELRRKGVAFTPHRYDFEEHGGTTHAASQLKLDEHACIKTLVMQSTPREALIVLMHGDCEVSTKALARILGVKRITPCDPDTAQRLTGYQVGGISPFGTRTLLPVCVEATILDLERIYINGGKRGLLVEMDPASLSAVIPCRTVRVAIRD